MKKLAILTIVVLGFSRPALAQHRGAVHGGGGMPVHHPAQHPANRGMPHMPAPNAQQIRQMQQQYQRQMQHQMQQMKQAYEQQQRAAQMHYDRQAKQFQEYLKAHGGEAHQGTLNNLKTPADFQRWMANQKKRKGQGKSYDPLYDHFRSFADQTKSHGSHKGAAAKENSGRSEKARNEEKRRQAEAARKEAGKHKHESLGREEKARRNRAENHRLLAQNQASVNLLRTAHNRLQQADHDYDGHRVRAMHHVGQAMQHLGSSAPMGLGLGGGSSLGNLPQSQSDGILRDSLQKLRTVESQLGSMTNAAAHHGQARTSVGQAIRELETALRIR